MVDGDVVDLYGDANYIYSAEQTSGVVAYTYSGTYTKKTTYNSPGSAQGVWADGVYAYLADGASGIRVLKFNDPAWISVSSIDVTTNSANGIWGDGTYIYAAEGTDGIRAYSGFACTSVSGTSGATWAAAQDTALSGLEQQKTKRLRTEVSNEGGATSSGVTYQLQYATSTSGPWFSLPDANWVMAVSSYVTEGAATTNFTGSLDDANPTFVAGQFRDTASVTSGITLTPSDFTELEYSVQATASAADGTYYFRVLNAADTTYFNYQVYPQVTLGGDVTAPLLASATVNGTSLVLTYTEINGLDTTSTPANGDFTIGGQTVTGVVVAANTVTLTLSPGVAHGDTVTISYTQVVGREIEDEAQNKALNLSGQAVTNNTPDTTVPVLASAAVNGTSLVLTYTEANGLVTTSTPANVAFSIGTTGAAQSVTGVVVASGTVTLTLSPGVSGLDTITVSYTAGTEPIRDAALNLAADLSLAAVTNNTPAAVLTGSLADNAIESEIVAGTETLVITLTNDTWHANIGSTSTETTALINGIDSAQGETLGWNLVVKAGLNDTHVVRTSDTVATITLPAFSTYNITANETISVLVPAAALVTSGSDVGATTNFNVLYQSATLSGTLSDNAVETELRSSGQTLVITLVNDTWHANIGSASAETTALINGLDSAQGETTGWNTVVQAGLNDTHVVRTSATVATITLPAFSTYDITAQETITVTVPAAALVSSGSDLEAATTFNTTVATGSLALTGTVTNDNEEDIRTGLSTIVLTLTDDTWHTNIGTASAETTALITNLDSAGTDPSGWDNVVKAGLNDTHVVRTTDWVVTITLPAFGSYDPLTNETITATAPASVLVQSGSNFTASPTFNVLAFTAALTGTLADNAVETELRSSGQTLVITLTNDTWHANIGSSSTETTALINGLDSAQGETLGWDTVVKAGLNYTHVVRTNDTVATITLPAFSTYDITAQETITVTVPAAAVATSTTDVEAGTTFNTTVAAGSAALTGTVTDDNEEDIRAGTSDIVLTLTDDSWLASGAGGGFPQVQSVTETSFGTDALNHLVAMPATVNSGDLLIVLSQFDGGVDPSGAPTGWSQLWTGNGSGYAKVADGTEGGTTVDFATSASESGAAQTYRISDWYGQLSGVEVGTAIGTSGTSIDPPSLTATWGAANNLWIAAAFWQDDDETVTGGGYPTNYTNGVDTLATGPINTNGSVGTARREFAAADTENPGAFTITGSESVYANTIVIRPTPPSFEGERQNIINGLDSAQGDTFGWDAVVKTGINVTDVVRTSDKVVTITLPAFGSYDPLTNETITATVPASALVQSGSNLTASPTFNVLAITAALTGTLADNATETELRSSGQTLVITLTNDTWHANIGSASTETTALINGLDSAQGETKGWDAVVKAGLNDTHVVRTNQTVVTITLPAFSTYDISAQETITVTVARRGAGHLHHRCGRGNLQHDGGSGVGGPHGHGDRRHRREHCGGHIRHRSDTDG